LNYQNNYVRNSSTINAARNFDLTTRGAFHLMLALLAGIICPCLTFDKQGLRIK